MIPHKPRLACLRIANLPFSFIHVIDHSGLETFSPKLPTLGEHALTHALIAPDKLMLITTIPRYGKQNLKITPSFLWLHKIESDRRPERQKPAGQSQAGF
jgi:hypothetical protein